MNKEYDVVVAGAGPSGICAAIAAAREGSKVLLIEKNSFPGGMNTAAMVHPIMTFHAGEKQVIKGLAQEIISRLVERGASLGHVPDPIGMVSTITPIDSQVLKLVYFEMLSEWENLTLILNSFISSVSISKNEIETIEYVNKSGTSSVTSKVFVDATGDGDIMYLSKSGFVMGREKDGLTQPMSLMFTLGNIDIEAIVQYIEENPEQFILNSDERVNLRKYLAVSGFFDLVKKAKTNGDFSLNRDRVLLFQEVNQNEVLINMTRVTKLSGVNSEDLTKAEIEAYKQVDETVRFLKKYIPGFKNCFLREIAPQTGVRETRRLVGIQTLTESDIIDGKEHENTVAMCAFPIDIHDPSGSNLHWVRKEKTGSYDIPYGVMVPKKTKNLLVTGRAISTSHESLASARISATAMALGEAAGIAASLSSKYDISCSEVNPEEIQNILYKYGAVPGKKWL